VATLRKCDPKAIFVENAAVVRTLREAGADALEAHWVLMSGEAEGVLSLDGLRQLGRDTLKEDRYYFENLRENITPDDFAILYMTSGATGEPKMGIVNHRAILANADMGPVVLNMGNDDHILDFLPSAHITQRVVGEFVAIRMGVQIWFSEGVNKLPVELRKVRPTLFVAPPRLYERIHHSIAAEIRKKNAVARGLFYMAVGLGADAARRKHARESVPPTMKLMLAAFRRLVYKKILDRMGGRIRVAASGGAPLGKDLADFFYSIGLPLVEGYGLTEGGVTNLNPFHRPKPGSIGKALPGVEERLSEEGELLIRSATLFHGYYRDPEATATVLKDGWLYTGDIAEIDEEGYVFITGRKKELIVSSNGKKIHPAKVEALFKMEPLINQVLLLGDRLPYIAALFTINAAAAEALPGMESRKGISLVELAASEPVAEEVKKAVARVNAKLAPVEKIRKYRILDREFTIEKGEITPTMKLRRAVVLQNLKDVVAEIYGDREEAAESAISAGV